MTAQELIQLQTADSGAQLSKALDGFDETKIDEKLNAGVMSVREQVIHLCDVYEAVKVISTGEKYDWGSFKPESPEWESLLTQFRKLRSEAVAVVSSDSEDAIKNATFFMVAHEYYHVGQIVMTRIAAQPAWDPYAIYGETA